MGKAHPMELHTRMVDFVEEGNSHRAAAARFRVSVKFVNDMVRLKLKRETGSPEPKPQGRRDHGKLADVHDQARSQIERKPDVTPDGLVCVRNTQPSSPTTCPPIGAQPPPASRKRSAHGSVPARIQL